MLGVFVLLVFSSAVVAATCNSCSDGTCDEISFVQKHVNIAHEQLHCDWLTSVSMNEEANVAFWAQKCSLIPEEATMVRMSMGEGMVHDYFKPTSGSTLCEMLQANNKHKWSRNGHNWQVPTYFKEGLHLGGSSYGWPIHNAPYPEGNRTYLSFWGTTTKNRGGCCSDRYERGGSWKKPFKMFYCYPLEATPEPTPSPTPSPTQVLSEHAPPWCAIQGGLRVDFMAWVKIELTHSVGTDSLEALLQGNMEMWVFANLKTCQYDFYINTGSIKVTVTKTSWPKSTSTTEYNPAGVDVFANERQATIYLEKDGMTLRLVFVNAKTGCCFDKWNVYGKLCVVKWGMQKCSEQIKLATVQSDNAKLCPNNQ